MSTTDLSQTIGCSKRKENRLVFQTKTQLPNIHRSNNNEDEEEDTFDVNNTGAMFFFSILLLKYHHHLIFLYRLRQANNTVQYNHMQIINETKR